MSGMSKTVMHWAAYVAIRLHFLQYIPAECELTMNNLFYVEIITVGKKYQFIFHTLEMFQYQTSVDFAP